MPPTHVVPQWIGPHHHVIEERHFEVDDPEERAIDGLRCRDCGSFEETRRELVHLPCEAA